MVSDGGENERVDRTKGRRKMASKESWILSADFKRRGSARLPISRDSVWPSSEAAVKRQSTVVG